jgi:hemoglobin-like flavoprotein
MNPTAISSVKCSNIAFIVELGERGPGFNNHCQISHIKPHPHRWSISSTDFHTRTVFSLWRAVFSTMGSGLTTSLIHPAPTRQEIIEIMMPVYYLGNNVQVTSEYIVVAKDSWSLITDDQSQEFLKQKLDNPNFSFSSCIGWFYIVYYERLFDIHPLCKPLFTTGIISQGKFLVKMISLTLNQLHDPVNFHIVMKGLALSHCAKGVRSVEYGIVGSVLFYTLQKVLGEQYTPIVSQAWTKIYSKMLAIIVPMVVDYELQGDDRGVEGGAEALPSLGGGGGGGGNGNRVIEE